MPKRAVPVVLLLGLVPALATGQVPLGPEFQVNSYTTNQQGVPSVGCGGNGECVVVWSSFGQDGHRGGIFGQRYDVSGARIGVEFQVNTYTPEGQQSPSVAVDPLGRFMVVWGGRDHPSGSDYGYPGVFARQYTSTGTPGPEFRVNSYTTGRQAAQRVAAIADGLFVVVWHDFGQHPYGRVFRKIYDASGTPILEGTIGSGNSRDPAVAADATNGAYVVVWQDQMYGWDVFGQRFLGTSPNGAEFQVNSYTTGSQRLAAVAMDANLNFVVVWESGGAFPDYNVSGQRFLPIGAPDGGEFQVNVYTAGRQSYPVVASDAAGMFVVAWTSTGQDGSSEGVFARRYDAYLAPTSEFAVNSQAAGAQRAPSIAVGSTTFAPIAEFVVAWQSYSQDGSAYGVFGRRFTTDLSTDPIFKDCFSPSCP